MTIGDNLFGLETFYKGIKMRSRLETKFAFLLDGLNINWTYEPKTFLLSSGIIYKPDFYLTELNTWVEVKGNILEHNKEVSKNFVKDNNTELILISNTNIHWYSNKDFIEGICEDKDIYLGFCSKCRKHYFCSNLGSYHCRICNYHDGDSSLKCSINSFNENNLDISDLNSIKRFLDENDIHI